MRPTVWTEKMIEDAGDLADYFADVCGEHPALSDMMVPGTAQETTQLFIEGSLKAVLTRRVDLAHALLGAIAWGIFVAENGKTHLIAPQQLPS